jgi:hypothetical protein
MDVLRRSEIRVLLVVAAVGTAVGLTVSWLPLLFSAPWLAGIVWFARRGGLSDGEPPSLAEAARTRLWTHG